VRKIIDVLWVDGFAPASIVAPLGTVAILCNALIAPLVFHETFRLRDLTGIVLSTAGAVTIVLSAKTQEEKVTFSIFLYEKGD
jgi:magnesium transporter